MILLKSTKKDKAEIIPALPLNYESKINIDMDRSLLHFGVSPLSFIFLSFNHFHFDQNWIIFYISIFFNSYNHSTFFLIKAYWKVDQKFTTSQILRKIKN